MIPSHALRLQTMLRSMVEVILPAIDANQQLARDQAQILVGNLKLLAEQAARTYDYELAELREFVSLLRRLGEQAQGGAESNLAAQRARALLARLEPIAALPIPRETELASLVTLAREAADGVVAATALDGTPASRAAVAEAVLQQATTQNLRERVWFRAAGMDPAPETLPTLDEVLGQGRPPAR